MSTGLGLSDFEPKEREVLRTLTIDYSLLPGQVPETTIDFRICLPEAAPLPWSMVLEGKGLTWLRRYYRLFDCNFDASIRGGVIRVSISQGW